MKPGNLHAVYPNDIHSVVWSCSLPIVLRTTVRKIKKNASNQPNPPLIHRYHNHFIHHNINDSAQNNKSVHDNEH